MADDWVDVPAVAAAKPAPAGDGWEDVPKAGEAAASGPAPPISGPDGWSTAAKPMINSTPVGGIMRAFGQGFGEGAAADPNRLNLGRGVAEWLSEKGIFAPKGQGHYENPFQAFNEGVMVNAATALDGVIRTSMGLFRGGQAATMEALGGGQFGRDIAALPEAFMGSPGGLGKVEFRPSLPIGEGPKRIVLNTPEELASLPPAAPERIVGAAIKSKDGEIFSGVNHGDAGTALFKAGHELSPTESGDGFLTSTGRFVNRDEALDIAEKSKQLYDPELNRTNRPDATLHAQDLDLKNAQDLGVIGPERPPITEGTPKEVAERVTSVAAEGPKGEKITRELPDAPNPWRERFDQFVGKVNTPDDAKQLIRDAADQNGEFQAARQGTIPLQAAPEPVPAAHAITSVERARMDLEQAKRRELLADPEKLKAYSEGRTSTPEEMKALLEENYKNAESYLASGREPIKPKSWVDIAEVAPDVGPAPKSEAGPIPLHQLEALTEAAGVDRSTVSAEGIGRLLQNDNQVRNAMQAMLTATDNVRAAARDVKTDGSEANLMKLQEAMLRRDTWVEQVVGHRAEWGRTGNVFQEFMQKSKEEGGFTQFLKDQDRSPEGLKKIADALGDMDGTQAARFLSEANKPTFWDKFRFYWINALISGPVTHAKYIVANAAFAGYESAIVTPVAGAVGAVRRGIYGDVEGVYAGEAAARTWGIIAGVPDALKAGLAAAKTGLQTALPGELAQSIIPKQNKNVTFQQRPIPGTLGAVIGAPSRGASAIHSFFNFLGYRASIEAQAYRQAVKEGLRPGGTPTAPVPVTAEQLRTGRAKPETDYHMSPAAMNEPEPYHAFAEMARTLPGDVNGKFQVHGLLAGDRDANLLNLLEKGIDPNREFHSGAPRGGTSGVDSTRTFGSPYLLVSDEGKGLRQTGVKNVVAVGPAEANLPALKAAYPNVNFMTVPEAESFMKTGQEPPRAPVQSSDSFWQRRAAFADQPPVEMMNSAIEEGYRLTYISELGKTGKALSSFVHSTKVGTLIMPFTHIPMNILKRAVEGTPAAFLDSETRDALKGDAGAAKQDMAIARMVVGSAVGVWAVNQVLNERMTGFGPTEPKERAQWIATGHQPYSIRIGDYWYSFNRFGSLGTMLGLYSNLAEVIPHLKPDAEELTKAIGMTVHSTGRLMEDEVGMQGLAGLMDAINEPDRKGARYVANFAGSLLPYSSMQRQIASAMDPYMRETKSVVDGLRYYIPNQRQGLELKRDWTGLPVANTGYGGDVPYAPGLSAIIKHGNAVADPIALEMQALDLHPAPPQNRISGVKLPPKIYDAYQSTAGAFTREALTHYVEQPNWHELPVFVREQMFKATIESTRKAAAAATQMQYPQIIQQGVDDRVAKIKGEKPTKMKDPRLIMNGPQAGMGIRG